VAAFYADECFPLPVVDALRRRGHDVLTALEAGQANQRVPDDAVLECATRSGRAVLTLNGREFIARHARIPRHAGIAVCTEDADVRCSRPASMGARSCWTRACSCPKALE